MNFLKPENKSKAQKWYEGLENKGFFGNPYKILVRNRSAD